MKISDIFENEPGGRLLVEYSELFKKSLKKLAKRDSKMAQRAVAKLDEFLGVKSADPNMTFGTSDRPFAKGSQLDGFAHFHVSRNPAYVVIYRIERGTIIIYDLVDHEDVWKKGGSKRLAHGLRNVK